MDAKLGEEIMKRYRNGEDIDQFIEETKKETIDNK
jgi:hypothetical protein